MLRIIDLLLASCGLVFGLPLLIGILLINYAWTDSPLFLQVRVGRHKKPFVLVKFRTMKKATPSVATHLADPSAITPLGRFLRRTKLDELPQLWNVLIGDMSIVGPRPCLFSQTELIAERDRCGVFDARPGITGLAQIQGIDMATPPLLAKTDERMLESLNLRTYVKYILLTLTGAGRGDHIKS
jgi:O-antigen biosynthesis protein WbqP